MLAMITGEFDFDNLFANTATLDYLPTTEINIFSTANSNNTTLGSQEPISTTSDIGLSSVDPENRWDYLLITEIDILQYCKSYSCRYNSYNTENFFSTPDMV